MPPLNLSSVFKGLRFWSEPELKPTFFPRLRSPDVFKKISKNQPEQIPNIKLFYSFEKSTPRAMQSKIINADNKKYSFYIASFIS